MIYVVKHKPDDVFLPEGYKELKVGKIFEHPDKENIEHLNRHINELTGLYYIWKNTDDEIVGLNHYRRFFAGPDGRLGWQQAQTLAKTYDMIISVGYGFGKPMIENLAEHFPGRRDVFMTYYRMLTDMEPGLAEYFETEEVFNPTNMFLARREIMSDYCSWLFPKIIPVAEKFAKKDAYRSKDTTFQRMIGFMSERLLTYYVRKNRLAAAEWPIFFREETGNGKDNRRA